MILKNNNFYKFNYGFQSKKRRVLKLNTILLESRWIKDFFWGTILSHLFYYPVPSNLNYFWGFGSILGGLLIIQIVTGLLLTIHYIPDINLAFYSIEFIMRNVQNGWLIRYMHSSGASFLFIMLYCHMLRAIYYRLFRNTMTWLTGLVLFVLMMATGFLGYVIVWGQMSLWGATVICNLFGAIPYIGDNILVLLWGGFSVDNPTLKRFFALHFLLPFIIIVFSLLHLLCLHKYGSSNPLGVDSVDYIFFYPKYVSKDVFCFFSFYGFALLWLVFYYPNVLGHPNNYECANALITPKHITPEWYFEPFYAVLRSIPNKLLGVIVMGCSILILSYLPLLEFTITSTKFSSWGQFCFWFFVGNFICLGWLGTCPIEDPFILFGRIATDRKSVV